MLAEGCIVANPVRDLVGSVGRAELGRGAAARGGGSPNGAAFFAQNKSGLHIPGKLSGCFSTVFCEV